MKSIKIRMGYSIKTRFTVTIAALTLGFFLLVAIGSVTLGIMRVSAEMSQQLTLSAQHKLDQINLRLTHLLESVDAFATSSLAINSLIDATGHTNYFPAAISELNRLPGIESVIAYDFSGKPIAKSKEGPSDWFNLDSVKQTLSWGRHQITFNETLGSFAIAVPIRYFDTPQGGVAILVNADALLHQAISDNEYAYQLTIGNQWRSKQGDIQGKHLTGEATPPEHSLLFPFMVSLRVSISNQAVRKPVLASLLEMSLIGIVGLIILIVLARKVGSSLANPIIELVEKVRAGIHPTAPIGTGDELDLLATAFDQKTQHLLAAKSLLERRVEERTLELQEKADALERHARQLEEANSALAKAHSELKKLDKMKDEFISVVSHELRTPLSSIHGALSLVVSGALKEDQNQIASLLRMAMTNSERLGNLINDLLDFQKLSSGQFMLAQSDFNVGEFIDQAIAHAQGLSNKYQVTLEHINPPATTINAYADPHRMRQVIDNLISNAIKFSPSQGSVKIWMETDANWIRINVRDYGSGIPEQFKEHIFSKFSQADASDKRSQTGTGLGLSICKGIMDAHKGKIGYQSLPDGGTLFWIQFSKSKNSVNSKQANHSLS